MKLKKVWTMLVLPFAMAVATGLAHAAYPEHVIKIVAPYSAGGSSDLIARIIGDQLGAELGQPVVVENKPGAGSMLGTAYVAQSKPDGYTLLLADVPFTIVPALYAGRLEYDPKKDFVPLALIGQSPMYLFVKKDFQADTVKKLVDMAKASPGRITFGSGGNGSLTHMMGELFMQKTDTKLVHVPYKGAAASISGLAGGQIDISFSSMPSAAAIYEAKRIVPIAVSAPERNPATPDVPTLMESGVPDMAIQSWWGLMAPKGTPAEALKALEAAMQKVLKMEGVREKLARLAVAPPSETDAAALGRFLQADFGRWEQLVKDANISIQ